MSPRPREKAGSDAFHLLLCPRGKWQSAAGARVKPRHVNFLLYDVEERTVNALDLLSSTEWAGAELNRRHADFQSIRERNHHRPSSIISGVRCMRPPRWSTVIDTRFGQRFGQFWRKREGTSSASVSIPGWTVAHSSPTITCGSPPPPCAHPQMRAPKLAHENRHRLARRGIGSVESDQPVWDARHWPLFSRQPLAGFEVSTEGRVPAQLGPTRRGLGMGLGSDRDQSAVAVAARRFKADLTADLGGDPSRAQATLIELAARTWVIVETLDD